MQRMSSGKKVVLCGMLSVASLQAAAVFYAIIRLGLEGTTGLVAAAPLALLTFLVGLGLEVVGVLYLVVPSTGDASPESAAPNDSGSEK